MKKTIFLLMVIVFMLFWCPYGRADADKVIYELQEKCGKAASELFKKEYGNGGWTTIAGDKGMASYTNHYNVKLNKCFILLRTIIIDKGKGDDRGDMFVAKTLSDINENKEYGSFSKFQKERPSYCKVVEKQCNSEAEWEALIKPYMEE
jgi:hypothetical protein